MSVRLRRLKADYERMCTVFGGNARIKVLKTVGSPPEKYQVEFLVTSLQKELAAGRIRSHNSFLAEVVLTGSYPRMAPQCKMLTPVFHPNIAPHAVCIGDHWAAGETLPSLIVRMGEMLAFQSYNVKSPLNGEAAQWVEKNQDKLPLDLFDFSAMLSAGEAVGRTRDGRLKAGAECANCAKKAENAQMLVCMNRHVTCPDCMMECPQCQGTLCLKCDLEQCAACRKSFCHKCVYKCSGCGRRACTEHTGFCHICKKGHCLDCLIACEHCRQPTCIEHIKRVQFESGKQYACGTCAP